MQLELEEKFKHFQLVSIRVYRQVLKVVSRKTGNLWIYLVSQTQDIRMSEVHNHSDYALNTSDSIDFRLFIITTFKRSRTILIDTTENVLSFSDTNHGSAPQQDQTPHTSREASASQSSLSHFSAHPQRSLFEDVCILAVSYRTD